MKALYIELDIVACIKWAPLCNEAGVQCQRHEEKKFVEFGRNDFQKATHLDAARHRRHNCVYDFFGRHVIIDFNAEIPFEFPGIFQSFVCASQGLKLGEHSATTVLAVERVGTELRPAVVRFRTKARLAPTYSYGEESPQGFAVELLRSTVNYGFYHSFVLRNISPKHRSAHIFQITGLFPESRLNWKNRL